MAPNAGSRIALVDDEEHIRETVGFALNKEGYAVASYPDGVTAWEALQEQLPDLAILDIMMPRMDGFELCRRLRGVSEELPIIFLTSRDEEFDRVLGLELGGDDYLCKPFSTRELLARIKVLLRRLALIRQRAPQEAESLLDVGDLRLDLQRYQVTWKRYPYDAYVSDRTIDSHIKRLRAKFESVDAAFAAIETVHGLGYRYAAG